MNRVLGVARADFLERVRRFSFIAMIALALFAVFWFVPRDDGTIQFMVIQPDRFIQAGNPSWISITSAWGLGFFLPLIGFFYLRNSITYDEKSGVSQLITSSPIKNIQYIVGKLLSGTLLLYCFAVVVILGSIFMTIWRFPGAELSFHSLLSPFLFLVFVFPLCAAFALLFESVHFLRGSIGSIIYVVIFFYMYSLMAAEGITPLAVRLFDFTGLSMINFEIADAVLKQSGQPMDIMMAMGSVEIATPPTAQLFFDGVYYTMTDLTELGGKTCISMLFTIVAALLYNPVRETAKKTGKSRSKIAVKEMNNDAKPVKTYKPIKPSKGPNVIRQFLAEFSLMLSGQTLVWMIIGGLGIIACVFVDLGIVQKFILPILMLWFIGIFSAMGSREYQNDMLKIIATVPSGRLRQVIFSWLSGFVLVLIVALPAMVRMLLADQIEGVLACLAGVVFLPSFALFAGEFTKTSRAFELVFIVMTYFIINNVTTFMYMGVHPDVVALSRAGIYLTLGVVILIASIIKRNTDRVV